LVASEDQAVGGVLAEQIAADVTPEREAAEAPI
jgi:hypothetical protein